MFRRFVILFCTVFLLGGCVETVVVGSVVGGAIILSDGTMFDVSQDSRLETAVKKSLKNSSDWSAYKNVNVNVFNGKVLLTGYVENNAYKNTTILKTKSVKDGIEIMDEIAVFGPTYKVSSVTDSLISSQISLKLRGANGVTSGNYKSSVVDGVVFIIGKSGSKDELKKVTDVISRIKGVKKVVSYIVVVNN